MRKNFDYCAGDFPPAEAHYLLDQLPNSMIDAYMEFLNLSDECPWVRYKPIPVEDEIEYE